MTNNLLKSLVLSRGWNSKSLQTKRRRRHDLQKRRICLVGEIIPCTLTCSYVVVYTAYYWHLSNKGRICAGVTPCQKTSYRWANFYCIRNQFIHILSWTSYHFNVWSHYNNHITYLLSKIVSETSNIGNMFVPQ